MLLKASMDSAPHNREGIPPLTKGNESITKQSEHYQTLIDSTIGALRHIHPPERFEKQKEYVHRLELKVDGKCVGYADLIYINKPVPLYYLQELYIDLFKRGKGFGKHIFQSLNKFLDGKGKMGILLNCIDDASPAREMYKNNGWIKVPNTKASQEWLIYNPPCNIKDQTLTKLIREIENWECKPKPTYH